MFTTVLVDGMNKQKPTTSQSSGFVSAFDGPINRFDGNSPNFNLSTKTSLTSMQKSAKKLTTPKSVEEVSMARAYIKPEKVNESRSQLDDGEENLHNDQVSYNLFTRAHCVSVGLNESSWLSYFDCLQFQIWLKLETTISVVC